MAGIVLVILVGGCGLFGKDGPKKQVCGDLGELEQVLADGQVDDPEVAERVQDLQDLVNDNRSQKVRDDIEALARAVDEGDEETATELVDSLRSDC